MTTSCVKLFALYSSHTDGLCANINALIRAAVFVCQQQTDTPVFCSLITPSEITSPQMRYIRRRQSQESYTTKKHFISIARLSSFLLVAEAFWHSSIRSSLLYVGDIHCVARGCCQWLRPPPGLPSSSLWLQTAKRKKKYARILS